MIFQTFVRKHHKIFLFVILLFVGVPMTLFVADPSAMFGPPTGGTEIGSVAGIPVTADELAAAIGEQVQQRQMTDPAFSPQSLAVDGTLSTIRENLIRRKLVEAERETEAMIFSRDFLADQLKKDPQLQTADGQLDAEMWNTWVQDERVNWNALYENQAAMARGMVYGQRIMAGARVLESDLRKQFEEQNTEVAIKYMSVELPVEPDEERLRAFYDREAPIRYQTPQQVSIRYAAFPLTPPAPAVAAEVLEKAKAGESFTVLASEHSEGPEKDTGGDLGWVTITEDLSAPRDALKDLAPGQTSDMIFWGRGYYIYHVDEERTNEAGQREVKARQIAFFPTMTDEEKALIEAKASDFRAAVEQGEDFSAFAQSNGLEVGEAGPFSRESTAIPPIPSGDVFAVRAAFSEANEGDLSEVIAGLDNLYIAQVTAVVPPTTRPYEEVADQVREAVVGTMKREPEYMMQVAGLANDIAAQATSLAEIPQQFPQLATSEIREMGPFTAQTFDFSSGFMINPASIMEAVAGKEPGALVGPIQDFLGGTYFVEVVSVTPPTQEAWDTQWPEMREQLAMQNLGIVQSQYSEDYVQYLEEKAFAGSVNIDLSDSAMLEVLNMMYPPEETPAPAETETPAVEDLIPALDTVTVEEGAAAEPAAESAPATAPAEESAPAAEAPAAQP